MDLYFSEFSYGYAVTQEYEQFYAFPLKAAPIFPSLQDEGTKGYDVELLRRGLQPGSPCVPLFLQFKLSERIERRYTGRPDDAYFTPPFYRVKVRTRRPDQHRLLTQLQAGGNDVYYIAPGFHRTSDLNENYSNGSVVANSVLVQPLSLGQFPEGEAHHFSFASANDTVVRVFSEPFAVKMLGIRNLVEHHSALLLSPTSDIVRLDERTLSHLEQTMLDIIAGTGLVEGLPRNQNLARWRDTNLLYRIAYIARVAFECTFFLIGHRAPGSPPTGQ